MCFFVQVSRLGVAKVWRCVVGFFIPEHRFVREQPSHTASGVGYIPLETGNQMHAGVHDRLACGKTFIHTHIETLRVEFILQLVFDSGDQVHHVFTFLQREVKK